MRRHVAGPQAGQERAQLRAAPALRSKCTHDTTTRLFASPAHSSARTRGSGIAATLTTAPAREAQEEIKARVLRGRRQ